MLIFDRSKIPFVQIIGPMALDKTNIRKDVLTFFVDGGLDHFKNIDEFDQHISVGDGDSLKCSRDKSFHYELPQDKDKSDLSFTLNLLKTDHQTIFLHGFSGGRKDHELINYLEIIQNLENSKRSFILDDSIIISNSDELEFDYRGPFSIVCLTDNNLSLSGEVKYKLNKEPLRSMSSQGLSNFAHGKFSIKCHKGSYLLFFS